MRHILTLIQDSHVRCSTFTTIEESLQQAERLVDVNTIRHTDAREVGAEWICLQAIRELEIDNNIKARQNADFPFPDCIEKGEFSE